MPFEIFRNLFKSENPAVKLVKQGAIIIDVRTRDEYRQGHIEGSRNIPLNTIESEAPALKKINKPVVTVCRSGHRSKMAVSLLAETGVQAYNGGAWTSLKKQLHKI